MNKETAIFNVEITHTSDFAEVAAGLAEACYPNVSLTPCCDGEGFDIEVCVTVGTRWGGDQQTEARIALIDTGDGESFDTALTVSNGDCLSMYEQIEMMQFVVEWFDQLRKECGICLIGHTD